jgi:hypothetical protein
MTIRRRCTERNCRNGRRCLEHLRFDVMYRGKRYRVPANEFAIPRMDQAKQRPIQSMEEARDWERMFIGEIKAGRDPLRPRSRTIEAGTDLGDVSAFLDAYLERCVKPAGLRSIAAVRSRVAILKEHLGQLRLPGLEEPDEINRFKTESEHAEDVEIATMHRVLETLRATMNWGMAQTPPLFNRSPFHRFGVRFAFVNEIWPPGDAEMWPPYGLTDVLFLSLHVPDDGGRRLWKTVRGFPRTGGRALGVHGAGSVHGLVF